MTGCGRGETWEACDLSPNGCGSGAWPIRLLLNCPLGLVCFTGACDGHDACYRMCGVSKSTCDDAFYGDLAATCAEHWGEGAWASSWCLDLAYVYWQATVRFGQNAFDDDQTWGCACAVAGLQPQRRARMGAGDPPGVAPFDDADDDLMPDAWETMVGLDPADPTDALEDCDSDGLLNLAEYLHNTDPFDPASGGAARVARSSAAWP